MYRRKVKKLFPRSASDRCHRQSNATNAHLDKSDLCQDFKIHASNTCHRSWQLKVTSPPRPWGNSQASIGRPKTSPVWYTLLKKTYYYYFCDFHFGWLIFKMSSSDLGDVWCFGYCKKVTDCSDSMLASFTLSCVFGEYLIWATIFNVIKLDFSLGMIIWIVKMLQADS